MGIFDFLEEVADIFSGDKKQEEIDRLTEENERLRYERDYAIELNHEKDDFVKSLGGRLLQKGDPEGGRLLADWKKFKKGQ